MVAGAGFDWFLLDMEHSPNDLPQIVDQLRAAEGGTAEPVVRVPWNEPGYIMQILDAGALLTIDAVKLLPARTTGAAPKR